MTEQRKQQIVQGLREYLDSHKEAGMSQAKAAKACGINPALPRSLVDWLRRALARAAGRRFADAGEMRLALLDAMSHAGCGVA